MAQRCWVKCQCRGVLLFWIIVGQVPIALAEGAGGVVWTLCISSILLLSFCHSERRPDTVYCFWLNGPLRHFILYRAVSRRGGETKEK